MQTIQMVHDAAVAGAAGYVGTKAMEQFNTRTYALQAEADRQREEDVRPDPPFQLAAETLPHVSSASRLTRTRRHGPGRRSTTSRRGRGPRSTCCCAAGSAGGPVASGLDTGAAMSLLLDETITPTIGASASNDRYPASTHVRAFGAHLVFGLAVAGVMEVGTRLLGRAR